MLLPPYCSTIELKNYLDYFNYLDGLIYLKFLRLTELKPYFFEAIKFACRSVIPRKSVRLLDNAEGSTSGTLPSYGKFELY